MKQRKKRVIILSKKNDFHSKISALKQKVEELQKSVEKLFKIEIDKAINGLTETLGQYFKQSKPDFLEDDSKINDFIDYIISKINFPSASSFKDQIKLECSFYDFTWEDLRSETILKELKDNNVIAVEDYNEIVNIRKAFDIKK